jgi:hypothetical protein
MACGVKMRKHAVFRIMVYVPPEHCDPLLSAIRRVCELQYGKYADVAWISAELGTERFRPEEGSIPTEGKHGVLFAGKSVRVEFSVPRDEDMLRTVLGALKEVHPWEAPVILVSTEYEIH